MGNGINESRQVFQDIFLKLNKNTCEVNEKFEVQFLGLHGYCGLNVSLKIHIFKL